jgi:hypothetical protein
VAVKEHSDKSRETECDCDGLPGDFPCWPCIRDGQKDVPLNEGMDSRRRWPVSRLQDAIGNNSNTRLSGLPLTSMPTDC